MTRQLLIIKCGSKLESLAEMSGDFEHWIATGMDEPRSAIRVCAPPIGEPLPPAEALRGVVITGSAAMVTDRDPWMEQTAAWLNDAVHRDLPVLGICFGHQLLAHALGGSVSDNPNGVEVGTVMTRCEEAAASDPLFSGLPPQFPVQASHRQAVVRLPEDAVRLARSDLDPHHAFRAGKYAWGVQFHPEFDSQTVNAYIRYYARLPDQQHLLDEQWLTNRTGPSPHAASLLQRFADRFTR